MQILFFILTLTLSVCASSQDFALRRRTRQEVAKCVVRMWHSEGFSCVNQTHSHTHEHRVPFLSHSFNTLACLNQRAVGIYLFNIYFCTFFIHAFSCFPFFFSFFDAMILWLQEWEHKSKSSVMQNEASIWGIIAGYHSEFKDLITCFLLLLYFYDSGN